MNRLVPTNPSRSIIILFEQPPIFKTEEFNINMPIRIKQREDRSMVTAKHRKMVNSSSRILRTPLSVS
jgi:hypothetical protein